MMHSSFRTALSSTRCVHSGYVVVGGGILGLATARHLLRAGISPVTVVEAQPRLATCQTGRNSGVVHAGLYYTPNSLKARLCVEGHSAILTYLQQQRIPHTITGKLVVATNDSESVALQQLHRNALVNRVSGLDWLPSQDAIRQVEPDVAGVAAIHSRRTAVVDWRVVAEHFADDVRSLGGSILLSTRVTSLRATPTQLNLELHTPASPSSSSKWMSSWRPLQSSLRSTLTCDRVITCTGVESDRVATSLGGSPSPAILPILGDYLKVTNERIVSRVRTNIYPVPPAPDPRTRVSPPFLGVHFTPSLDGSLLVGPNAVLAPGRSAYSISETRLSDLVQTLSQPALWRFLARHSNFAIGEMYRTMVMSAAVRSAIQYIPALTINDFERAPVEKRGIRAQAISDQGSLINDFVFESVAGGRILHVRNAPSPGATASLAIARVIVEQSLSGVDNSKT